MEIKNFLYFLIGSFLWLQLGCQSVPRRANEPSAKLDSGNPRPSESSGTSELSRDFSKDESKNLEKAPMGGASNFQLGLILGPGALRALAHVGFLQELSKAQVPVRGVVGLEMGALAGALMARGNQIFEPEWQILKLRDSDWVKRSVLGREQQSQGMDTILSWLDAHEGSARLENFSTAFACPALQLQQNQSFLLNRGSLRDVIPLCMAFPPLWKPHHGTVADFSGLDSGLQFLRRQGATHIVYVSVLDERSALPSADEGLRILWGPWIKQLERRRAEIDEWVRIPLAASWDDPSQKEEFIREGKKVGQERALFWLRRAQSGGR